MLDHNQTRSHTSPRELMLQAKHGNTEAYGALYEEYYTPVFRYLYRRLSDREMCEDLAQTVFLKVFKSIDRFTDRGVTPLAYFFTVARNTLIDYFKKKKAILSDDEDQALSVAANDDSCPEKTMHKTDQKAAILAALDTLKPDQKEALMLRFIDGLKNNEISAIMKKSEEAIRQLQSRGIRQLRDLESLKIHL